MRQGFTRHALRGCARAWLAFGLLATFQACSPKVVPRSVHAEPLPPWVYAAERESALYLTPRCYELAPLDELPSEGTLPSETYTECLKRAFAAVKQGWSKQYEGALTECRATGKSCCFPRIDDGPLYQAAQIRCDQECAASRGAWTRITMSCKPERSLSGIVPQDRFLTGAVRAKLSGCSAGKSRIEDCDSLPSNGERDKCRRGCKALFMKQIFDQKLAECVASPAVPESLCAIEELVSYGLDHAECVRQCLLGRKGIGAP